MNKHLYKVFQLIAYFIEKHGYSSFYIVNNFIEGEYWLANVDHPGYQLLRITATSMETVAAQTKHIEEFKEYYRSINNKEGRFLDIHVSKEEVLESDHYASVCIDYNYFSGEEDFYDYYPDIDRYIYTVDDQEAEIRKQLTKISQILKNSQKVQAVKNFTDPQIKKENKNKENKSKFNLSVFLNKITVSEVIIVISTLVFIASLLLSRKYSDSAAVIVLGADYKIFTLGLHEFYRLITGAFCHGNITHLICNIVSMYFVGQSLEPLIGKLKFTIVFLGSVLFGSLTSGILSGNSLIVGMSGGIYGLFVYLLMVIIDSKKVPLNSIMPTIFLNLFLNFLPNVSWQSHLGGAVCGLLLYYLFLDKKLDVKILTCIVLLLGFLSFKYVKDNKYDNFYLGTDSEVVEIYRNLGFEKIADDVENKLLKVYMSKGE